MSGVPCCDGAVLQLVTCVGAWQLTVPASYLLLKGLWSSGAFERDG
jgi:hypothetical protein